MAILETIIATIGGTAAVAWLAREIVVHFLDKDVAAYKIRLQAKTDEKLKALEYELRLNEFRSTKLHEIRASVIAEIYSKLAIAIEAADNFVHSGVSAMPPGPEGRAKETEEALKNFKTYFDAHRIYFDEPICILLDDFYKNISSPSVQFDTSVITSDRTDMKPVFDARRAALKQIREKAAPIRNALEKEFRRILGVIDGN